MLLSIAWRNVWRNPKRSLVMIVAITFGIWAGVFTLGFLRAMYASTTESAVSTQVGYLQVTGENYQAHPEIWNTLPRPEGLLEELRGLQGVESATARAEVTGMARSAATASGVTTWGVDPQKLPQVLNLDEKLVEGTWFEGELRNPALVGSELAKKLELKLGSKFVLQGQAGDSSLSGGAFRVAGIFRTSSTMFDETTVLTRRDDLDRIFSLDGRLHRAVVRITPRSGVGAVRDRIEAVLPEGAAVATWKDIVPQLAYITEIGDASSFVFLEIILLALVFGITNTMLMGVMERVRELGVLLAVGMRGSRVFVMVLFETVLLSLVGAVVGLAVSWATIAWTGRTGINLATVSEGLRAYGFSSVVHPTLDPLAYLQVIGLVVITALISSIYPGIKAVRLQPVEAIRTYG